MLARAPGDDAHESVTHLAYEGRRGPILNGASPESRWVSQYNAARRLATCRWGPIRYRLMTPLTMIDLFAGCGGMTSGFVDQGFKPVLAVEWNLCAAST